MVFLSVSLRTLYFDDIIVFCCMILYVVAFSLIVCLLIFVVLNVLKF